MVRFSAGLRHAAAPVFWTVFAVLAILVPHAGDADFNYDFASLEGGKLPAFVLDQKVNVLLGYSQTPVAILTGSVHDEAGVAEALRQNKERLGAESTIDFVATIADLVPDEQQAKREVMDQIQKRLKRVKLSSLEPDARQAFSELKEMLEAQPFDRASLPIELKRQFVGVGEDDSGFVLIFPAISLADGERVSDFAREIRSVKLADGSHVKASGEAMILADVLHMVQEEAPPILAMTLILIIAITWLMMGKLRWATVVIIPVIVLALSLLGYLSYIGMELNYMNIIVIPILLGVGVDGAVHLFTRTREEDGASWEVAVGETNRAIVAAFVTTGIGFGALLVAEHPGLNSIGSLSLVGTAANLIIIVLGFTTYLALLDKYVAATAGRPLVDRAAYLGATVGLAGLSPVGPGTIGALAAVPLALWLGAAPLAAQIAVVAVISVVAVPISQRYVDRYAGGTGDPSAVVIDELAGLLVTALFVPATLGWVAAAFIAFRAADILKPWPVSFFDRQVKGGLGIVLDDVVAGLLAGAALLLVRLAL